MVVNKIYLKESDFFEFLQKRIILVTKTHAKKTKQTNFWIAYKDLFVVDKKSILFVSQIDSISTPNDAFFPQIMVLYGLPLGLLSHRNEKYEPSKTKKISIGKENNSDEKDFLMLRRALLFTHVWMIKNVDIANAKSFFEKFIDEKNKSSLFLLKLLKEIAVHNTFPEDKPVKASIDDTIFKYQMIWLGRFFKLHVFNNISMDEKSRTWFLNCFHANPKTVTSKLKPFVAIIIGYVIALKAYNKGKHEFSFLVEILQDSAYAKDAKRLEILSYALFFVGLFYKKADSYFMSEVASKLFYEIEKNAFSLVHGKKIDNNIDEVYRDIREAFLTPIENCVNYYRIKNPSIANKSYYEYSKTDGNYPMNIPVLRPNQIDAFLKNSNKIIRFDYGANKSTFVTQNETLYKRFKLFFSNVLWLNRKREFEGSLGGFRFDRELVADSPVLYRWLRKIGFQNVTEFKTYLHLNKSEWVVLTSNSKIDMQNEIVLELLSKSQMPSKIYLFNFVEQKQDTDIFNYSDLNQSWNNRSQNWGSNYEKKEVEANQAMLQSKIKTIFPRTEVSVVTTDINNEPWEMVNLGIGLLRKTYLDNCVLIDSRSSKSYKSAYEVVCRCFSDVIVYDENQKYLFLNL